MGRKIKLIAFESYPYPDVLRKRLLTIANNAKTTAAEISSINVKVGVCFANSVLNLISKYNLKKLRLDFIGSHGQTISHIPKGGKYNKQILSPSDFGFHNSLKTKKNQIKLDKKFLRDKTILN